jgi:hypothetical protein
MLQRFGSQKGKKIIVCLLFIVFIYHYWIQYWHITHSKGLVPQIAWNFKVCQCRKSSYSSMKTQYQQSRPPQIVCDFGSDLLEMSVVYLKRKTIPSSQSGDAPWSSRHCTLTICIIALTVSFMCGNWEEMNSYKISVLKVQSRPMFLYLPYNGKLLNHSSITVWEGKHFQKCKCSTFGFMCIVHNFMNL